MLSSSKKLLHEPIQDSPSSLSLPSIEKITAKYVREEYKASPMIVKYIPHRTVARDEVANSFKEICMRRSFSLSSRPAHAPAKTFFAKPLIAV
jgi:hypothetical protein